MEWKDTGILLRLHPFGEDQLIGVFFTKEHGLAKGVMPFKSSDKKRDKMLHPGSRAQVRWKARLSEHLGRFDVDPEYSPITKFMNDADALAGLTAICSIVETWTPERETHEFLYTRLGEMIEELTTSTWPIKYVQFELELLKELGFGLDLETCALTGVKSNLIYVSSQTGRALSEKALEKTEETVLPLPAFLTQTRVNDEWTWGDVVKGLELTGHFFKDHLCENVARSMPAARDRLLGQFKAKHS